MDGLIIAMGTTHTFGGKRVVYMTNPLDVADHLVIVYDGETPVWVSLAPDASEVDTDYFKRCLSVAFKVSGRDGNRQLRRKERMERIGRKNINGRVTLNFPKGRR